MKITHQNQAINTKRSDKTEVDYYIFHEYEVHYGRLPPGIVQPWHHHAIINETLFVIQGKVKLHCWENNKKTEIVIKPGDVVQIEDTVHTFSNPFNQVCKMIAFRFVPQGIDQREVIKKDKILHPELDRKFKLL